MPSEVAATAWTSSMSNCASLSSKSDNGNAASAPYAATASFGPDARRRPRPRAAGRGAAGTGRTACRPPRRAAARRSRRLRGCRSGSRSRSPAGRGTRRRWSSCASAPSAESRPNCGGSCAMNFSRRALNAAGSGVSGGIVERRGPDARGGEQGERPAESGFQILDFTQTSIHSSEIDSTLGDERPGRGSGRGQHAIRTDDGGDALAVRLQEPPHGSAVGRLLQDVGARLVHLREKRLPDGLRRPACRGTRRSASARARAAGSRASP